MRNKDAHQKFLESNAAAQILQKDVQGTAKEVMGTVRTKIQQGIKLNEQEMDVYQQVLERAANPPRTGPAFPAADFLRNPDQRAAPQGGPAQGGAPVQVQSIDEARKLPSGSQFVGPDGILRRVP
jgi:hypothetical protein